MVTGFVADYASELERSVDPSAWSLSSKQPSSSKITVTRLLYAVKRTYPDQLTLDVDDHIGNIRDDKHQDIKGLRYSIEVNMPTDDQMLRPFDETTDEEYRQAVNVISSVLGCIARH